MASAASKIILSQSRDIPFNQLVLSQANVRRVKTGVSIEALAEDIARRTLLQSLNVRPQLDDDGKETGLFEVPAGGRRFRALELLVKQKRMAKTQPVPCVVREGSDISAEEDSLAENTHREQLHPLDQFRAMQVLSDQGLGLEDIAAHFMVTSAVVRQRLKLAAVSPRLHAIYADDSMTLDQLMAFSVCEDHERQEQVWEMLAHSFNRSPAYIRSRLTEDTVRASDKRVRFVTLDAYVAAGGSVMRDLFEDDHGGWLQDVHLLDTLVADRLQAEAARFEADGWKWAAAAVDFPWGYRDGMRVITGTAAGLTDEEQARVEALQAEAAGIENDYERVSELPDEVEQRLTAIDEELALLLERPPVCPPGRWRERPRRQMDRRRHRRPWRLARHYRSLGSGRRHAGDPERGPPLSLPAGNYSPCAATSSFRAEWHQSRPPRRGRAALVEHPSDRWHPRASLPKVPGP
jgi:ParB family chromosome partitioning protein